MRRAVAPKPKFAFKARLGGGGGGERARVGGRGEALGGSGGAGEGDGEGTKVGGGGEREASLRVVDRREECFVRREGMEMDATTGVLTGLQGCVVDLSMPVAAAELREEPAKLFVSVQIRNVRGSLIVAGRVDGPAHITDLRNCVVVVACRQFRMHDCIDVDVYLECGSHPIIEDCDGLRFAPLPQQYRDGKTKADADQWDKVDDFKWLKSEPSPHWRIMPEDVRVTESVWAKLITGNPDAERTEILQAVGIK